MKLLNVPLFLQEEDSLDCGPTCIRMLLKYYSIEKTDKELKKDLTYRKSGTTMYDNGSILLKNRLKTTVITAHPELFPPDAMKKLRISNHLLEYIDKQIGTVKKDKWILRTFKTYLENGGRVTIDIPVLEHLKHAIDEGNPVLALMNAQTMGSNEGKFHFVIVNGYRDNEVFITNPLPSSRKQEWFPFKQFIYGVHASTCAGLDNGTFLIPSK